MWSWVYILAGPKNIKHNKKGTSLVGQCLRLYTPNAEGSSSIPSQATRSYMTQLKIPNTTIKTWLQLRNKKQHKKMACLWAGKLEELWEAGGGCLISSKGYKDLNQVLNPGFLTN